MIIRIYSTCIQYTWIVIHILTYLQYISHTTVIHYAYTYIIYLLFTMVYSWLDTSGLFR